MVLLEAHGKASRREVAVRRRLWTGRKGRAQKARRPLQHLHVVPDR